MCPLCSNASFDFSIVTARCTSALQFVCSLLLQDHLLLIQVVAWESQV
ncbi:hypothetical protein TSMEX_002993, partial [Taenia solium]